MSWERLRLSYDQVAGRYEETFREELAEKPYDRELLDRWGSAVEDPVLEVGCGPGQVGAYLLECLQQVAWWQSGGFGHAHHGRTRPVDVGTRLWAPSRHAHSPRPAVHPVEDVLVDDVLAALNWSRPELDPSLPSARSSAGAAHFSSPSASRRPRHRLSRPECAGKTTTLRALLGLVRPTSGSVTFAGRRYADLKRPMRVVGAVLEVYETRPRVADTRPT